MKHLMPMIFFGLFLSSMAQASDKPKDLGEKDHTECPYLAERNTRENAEDKMKQHQFKKTKKRSSEAASA